MNPVNSPRPLLWPPMALGVASAAAVLLNGGAGWLGCALALALVAGGVSIGLWQAAQQAAQQRAIAAHLASEQAFSAQVAPIWSGHIESSREQMETAITALTRRFSGIVRQLGSAVQAAGMSQATMQDHDHGLSAVLARSQHELGVLIGAQKAATASMAATLDRVQGLRRFVSDLSEMASDVNKIAQHSNLLALNAAIEAARFGEQGRGFAVVAKEFRQLATLSGDTGRRIDEKVGVIHAGILEACAGVRALVAQEDASLATAEGAVGQVLGDFKAITDTLLQSSAQLKDESASITDEISDALVQLQFQDRVSQIMGHVKDNIERMPAYFEAHRQRYDQDSELRPIDTASWLDELRQTYAMEDQHAIHDGDKAALGAGGAGGAAGSTGNTVVTFF